MNIIGAIVAAVIIAVKHVKPIHHGHALLIRLGKNWGGVCLGMFIFVSETLKPERYNHEAGHARQNAVYGFLFPFIVGIPSIIRCAWWTASNQRGDYDSIWFEKQATEWGEKF